MKMAYNTKNFKIFRHFIMFEIKEIAFQSITKLKNFYLRRNNSKNKARTWSILSIPITFGESKILSKTNSL